MLEPPHEMKLKELLTVLSVSQWIGKTCSQVQQGRNSNPSTQGLCLSSDFLRLKKKEIVSVQP